MNDVNKNPELIQLRQDYHNGQNLINFGIKTLSYFSGIVEIIRSGSNPTTTLVSNIIFTAFNTLHSQIFINGYTQNGKISDRNFITSPGNSNQELIDFLSSNAKEMGIKGRVSIATPNSTAITQVQIMASSSFSFCPEISFSCHPALFYSKETLKEAKKLCENPEEIELLETIGSNQEYQEFIGACMLSLIKMDSHLYTQIAKFSATFLFKSLIDAGCKKTNITTTGFSYTIASGIAVSLISNLVETFIQNYFIAKADKHAVEITKNPKAAIACLNIFNKLPSINRLGFLNISFNQRMKLIDSDSPVSLDLKSEEEKPPLNDLVKQEIVEQKIKLYQSLFPVKLIREIKGSSLKAANLALLLGRGLFSAWIFRKVDSKYTLPFLIATQIIFPSHIEELNSQFWNQSKQNLIAQQRISILAKEMGIEKPIIARSAKNGIDSDYRAIGTAYGPGNAIVYVPSESESNEFALRHELAHVVNNDSLTINTISILTAFTIKSFMNDQGSYLLQGIFIKTCQYAVNLGVSRLIEARADKKAIEGASDKKLIANLGIEFFKSHLEDNISLRNDPNQPILERLMRKIFINAEGEVRISDHPSSQSRIKALEEVN